MSSNGSERLPPQDDESKPEIETTFHIKESSFASEAIRRQFENLPTKREAVRAKDGDDLSVFASVRFAKKLYLCPCCQEHIDIGSEHILVSRVQMAKQYNHHHLHITCFREKILPDWHDLKVIDPQETTATKMNKRNRRLRYKNR